MSLEIEAALATAGTHAEELRVIVENDGHFHTQRIPRSIASDYGRMAETFEQIESTNRSLRSAKSHL